MVIPRANSSTGVSQWRGLLGFPGIDPGTLPRLLIAVVLLLAASRYVAAQVDTDDVHVVPHVMHASSTPAQHIFRTNVDLVLVNVTVLDPAGRAVTGLGPTNFAVLDDKNPQIIKYLSNKDEPISLVVVLDASASMAPKIQEEREAFAELISESNPEDDFGLIVVDDQPRVALHFDDSMDESQGAVDALQPDGFTSLWDGIYLGIRELKNSRYQRKAMVVISDGGDNHSRYTESELESILKEADVEVYALGLFDRYATRLEERKGPLRLHEVSSVTGGRVFSVHDPVELSRAVTQISRELRNQYVVGYYPSNRARDGRWRRLKIRLTPSTSQEKLRLYAKKGYYAPEE